MAWLATEVGVLTLGLTIVGLPPLSFTQPPCMVSRVAGITTMAMSISDPVAACGCRQRNPLVMPGCWGRCGRRVHRIAFLVSDENFDDTSTEVESEASNDAATNAFGSWLQLCSQLAVVRVRIFLQNSTIHKPTYKTLIPMLEYKTCRLLRHIIST